MSLINQPPTSAVDTLEMQRGTAVLRDVSGGWRNFFNAVFLICNAMTLSGTTANRPSSNLWVGRTYFDTTINKPIWYVGPGWVDATGAPA